MKTILVPVDFSDTARNCALYAAGLANWVGANKLILFNAYSIPLATEMSWAVLQTEELRKYSEDGLAEFKSFLQKEIPGGMEIICFSEFGFLSERIEAVSTETKSDLIIMGITGGGKLEEALIGSNTTHILKHTHVPVLIVPAKAKWKPVETIGWACDYREIINTTPAEAIKNIVKEFKANLVVVHNDPDKTAFNPDKYRNNVMVSEMFHELQPEFVQVAEAHFAEAINHFVDNHSIDMLLAVPKKQNWLDSIFHPSHTKQLAFHSHVPLLCIQPLPA
ncbi:MAG: universal stress protein [Bacteroidota bacterium]